jgi:hypothetical protein
LSLPPHDSTPPPRRRHPLHWPLAVLLIVAPFALGLFVVAQVVGALSHGPADADAAAPRVGAQPVPPNARLKLVWVGDTMFGDDSAQPPDGGRVLFAQVKPWLKWGDLTMGNLEGVLATTGTSKCGTKPNANCYAFRADPADAAALKWAGFDVMNLANNHSLDYGEAARAETVAALQDAGVGQTGAPGQITLRRVNGLRVAFVGLAPYAWAQNSLDLTGASQLVARAGLQADVVIAFIHAGAEGSDKTHTPVGVEMAFGENRGDTRLIAHTLVDAGADLVLGSGPHVIRGIERYKGKLIAYSLGNFAGWHNFASSAVSDKTGVLQLTVDRRGNVLEGRWRSAVLQAPGVPVPDPANISAQLARALSISDFGADAWPISPKGVLLSATNGQP